MELQDKVYSITELKEKIANIVKNLPVYCVILFGSYAKGLAEPNSDVDLVIDSKGQLKGFDYYALLEDLVQALNKEVDLISTDQIITNSKIDYIIKNEGIIIYERKN